MILKVVLFFVLALVTLADPDLADVNDLAFFKLGTYGKFLKSLTIKIKYLLIIAEKGDTYQKEFYISRHFDVTWQESRAICQSFGMEFFSMDTEDEYNRLRQLLASNAAMVKKYIYVGAMTTDPRNHKWYWLNSGKRITYPMKWAANEPTNAGLEFCLYFEKVAGNQFHFHDGSCTAKIGKFICQKENLAAVFKK